MKYNLTSLKAKFLRNHGESENDVIPKETSILDHIEKIVNISQKYGIDKCYPRGKKHFDYVTGKLGISPLQAVLFSHFMERCNENQIRISEIAESIKCSTVRILKYINECEELEKKKLIRCSRSNNSISFRIPIDVRDSIRKHNELRLETNENLSISKFFSILERLFEERDNDELTYDSLKAELLDIIKLNMHLEFCKKIMSYNLYEDDLILLICFCHLSGNNDDDNIGAHDFAFLYEDKSIASDVKRCFQISDHTLINGKYIVPVNSDGFVNSEAWKVSDMAKKELLSELNAGRKQNYHKNLRLFSEIKPKKMFYNPRETGEIQKLISLLSEENYRKILDRLDGRSMRKGFACLFSGGPGTGKTETAYQIARETKRHIMMIDIANTKSCWYGESEKKIKEIFDKYRAAVDNSEIAPILLINEADAVISKRKELDSTSRSVDQADNAIQNIILQEIENLSGILIATTNMTQNLDHAFERRFLYKIVFDKPGLEGRKGLWSALLPALCEDGAGELSNRFELTGGQIENIARKFEVDAILNGGGPSMDSLVQYCKEEAQGGFTKSKKLGF